MTNNPQTVSVTLLVLNRMITTSITLPMEMLSAASDITRSQSTTKQQRNAQKKQLILHIAGLTDQPVTSSGSLSISPDALIDDIQHTDLIIIPALWRNPKQPEKKTKTISAWLKQHYQQGSIICAVGTGAFLLANAGLLANKPATTHWFFLDQFSKNFPDIQVKPDHLITQSDRLYCAGSVNSVADLMIHLIAQLYNPEIAQKVEQQFSPEIRRPADEVFYAFEQHNPHHDELIINVQHTLQETYSHKININALAKQFSISQRTLNRRFKTATGMTPMQYLNQIRLETAKSLLKKSNLTIGEIAMDCGFQEPGYFSKIFSHHYQLSPKAYRNSVRAKLFTL